MKIDDLKSYDEVIKYLDSQRREKHLLFGNGFSMAYDSKIFSYNALSTFIEKIENKEIKTLFECINTKNFEIIMQQLDNFIQIAKAFKIDKRLIAVISKASKTLKTSLIDAVKELHPEHVFIIPEKNSKSCFTFLSKYLDSKGKIFSTNYDLLLYWVLMRNESKLAIDGFGRDIENPDELINHDEELEFSELRWGKYKETQSIFYLHGTLPIFDNGVEIIKEEYESKKYLLQKISSRMERKEYPIFVTAGSANEKLNHIMHNKYLSNCYEQLTKITGSLVIFGFNFGESDTHIIDAINKAAKHGKRAAEKLRSIYIGVYSDKDLKHIERLMPKFKCKVNLYNARTTNIW